MDRLTQRFTTQKAFEQEVARISKRWERPSIPPEAFEVPAEMLPKADGKVLAWKPYEE
jgi:hypothetical protein